MGTGPGLRLLRHARSGRPGREGRPTQRSRDRSRHRGSNRATTSTATSFAASCATTSRPWPPRRSILHETCLYTVAPDEHFVIDFLPGRADVIVASPCSGHGFKFSCLIGKVLAELATTGESGSRIPPWRLPAAAHPVA